MEKRIIRSIGIYKNGRVVTKEHKSHHEAAGHLRMHVDTDDRNALLPMIKFFLSDGEYLMEYTKSEILDKSNWPAGR